MAFLGYSCGPWAHYEMPFDHLSRTWATWICSYGLCSYGLRSHGPYSHGTSSWSRGHDDKGHNYIDHKYVGHNHIGNSYIGHVFHLATTPMAECRKLCGYGPMPVWELCSFGLCSYGPCSYGPMSVWELCSCGLYSYGPMPVLGVIYLWSMQLWPNARLGVVPQSLDPVRFRPL